MTIQEAFDIALQHHQAGRLTIAETIYKEILKVQENHAEALHLLGVIAHQVGRHEIAVGLIQQSISLDPNNATAHSNLGEAYRALGSLSEAVRAFRRAVEINPTHAEVFCNLSIALAMQGAFDEAVVTCLRAISLNPDYAEARNNLGNMLRQQGRIGAAIASYQEALRLKPGYPEAHNNLGNALRDAGRFQEAVVAHHRALSLRPDYTEAFNNLANTLRELGHVDEAVDAYRRAIQLKPDYAEANSNLAGILSGQGRLEEAIDLIRKAVQLRPNDSLLRSNLIYVHHFSPVSSKRTIVEEWSGWNRQFSDSLGRFSRHFANDAAPERRLRIGYVSPDFQAHVVGRNVLPLFRFHDQQNFEIVGYSGVIQSDSLTRQFRDRADRWCSTLGMSDEALTETIRQDCIDILVDLTQHMSGNRLTAFARQPAPVQISFAGYPESTGLETIKYRISDKWMEQDGVPQPDGAIVKINGHEQMCLIDSFWCYDPCGIEIPVNGLPVLNSGAITFGSLNNFCKVNEPLLRLWARVLKAVKDSRLIILSHEGSNRQRTLEFLKSEGVESPRVEFVKPCPRKEYLELYHRLDIVLDTFPYNGHTTSLDALWMGVPVVSLCGERPVSRAGLSQLNNLGLPELVAFTEDKYEDIATKLANDIPRLRELRATLRQRMEKSVLMDGPHFARQIEACYRSMWRQWCESQTRSAQNPE